MVWSQLAGIRTPPIVTTDFLYIRFIRDRNIQEKDFGRIQKDAVAEMKRWARNLKRVTKAQSSGIEHRVNLVIVSTNNHYEEKLLPQDSRSKIEHDCIDLWSKATIRKYLPTEAKDSKKQKAGKLYWTLVGG